jgi:hypothetical protein
MVSLLSVCRRVASQCCGSPSARCQLSHTVVECGERARTAVALACAERATQAKVGNLCFYSNAQQVPPGMAWSVRSG